LLKGRLFILCAWNHQSSLALWTFDLNPRARFINDNTLAAFVTVERNIHPVTSEDGFNSTGSVCSSQKPAALDGRAENFSSNAVDG
jgi:hypothetical protein